MHSTHNLCQLSNKAKCLYYVIHKLRIAMATQVTSYIAFIDYQVLKNDDDCKINNLRTEQINANNGRDIKLFYLLKIQTKHCLKIKTFSRRNEV